MSGGTGGRPQVINKSVTCGVIDYIDAFDAAGNPVRYQIILSTPSTAAPSPSPGPSPTQGAAPPSHVKVVLPQEPRNGSAAVVTGPDQEEGEYPTLTFIYDETAMPDIPFGRRVNATVWPLQTIDPDLTHINIELTTGLERRFEQGVVVLFSSEGE